MQPPPPDARNLSVGSRRLRRWLDGFTERHGEVETSVAQDVVQVAAADSSCAWIRVPFPPLAGDLLEHVERSRRIGVLLVRRGGYAAGVFEGAQLGASKVGSAYVQGTTKAGGWSQQRYARRRANQASAAFGEAADVATRILLGARLDAVVVGGDKPAIDAVLADPRLAELVPLLADPWLNVGDPRLRVLQAAPDQFLAVRIAIFP
jgi:Actinobacteria/chloroflexi VLRF1 release factor